MKNGSFIDEDYFEKLLEEIREIRLSERRFYQKVTDIYATSIDYDPKSPISIDFFKRVQNKMHFAVSKKKQQNLYIVEPIQKKKIWALLLGKILETDVVIAKNYLSKEELKSLELIVSAFLDLAENSSIPKDVGRKPLFLTYLSLEISSKILFTELVEILFLLAIFFSESLVIKSNMTAL